MSEHEALVLVVEDEPQMRKFIRASLTSHGYRVLEASTGEEAQAIFGNDQHIEVLLTDIDLGHGMNGFELARWTRETHPDVRILLTSGVARMAQSAGALCDVPLLKPEFVRRVVSLLGEASACVPRVGDRLHPLTAAYRVTVLPVVREMLAANRLRMTDLFSLVPTRIIEPHELADIDPLFASLRNVNTPDEYECALRSFGAGEENE